MVADNSYLLGHQTNASNSTEARMGLVYEFNYYTVRVGLCIGGTCVCLEGREFLPQLPSNYKPGSCKPGNETESY